MALFQQRNIHAQVIKSIIDWRLTNIIFQNKMKENNITSVDVYFNNNSGKVINIKASNGTQYINLDIDLTYIIEVAFRLFQYEHNNTSNMIISYDNSLYIVEEWLHDIHHDHLFSWIQL